MWLLLLLPVRWCAVERPLAGALADVRVWLRRLAGGVINCDGEGTSGAGGGGSLPTREAVCKAIVVARWSVA